MTNTRSAINPSPSLDCFTGGELPAQPTDRRINKTRRGIHPSGGAPRDYRHVTKTLPRTRRRKGSGKERCRWCGRSFRQAAGRGRPRLYCRQSCRQQAHLARKLAATHGLGDDDVIISRESLEQLQGMLYGLQAALEDVERDLGESGEPDDVAEAFRWLRENAEPLADLWIEPRTTSFS
jgi:hypothetical protein